MEVFNIKIGFGDNEVTLTVLPAENQHYKIIYYGEILCAVQLDTDNETWVKIAEDKLEAGDLPFYKHDLSADRRHIVLDEFTIRQIGEEIQNY